MNGSENRNGNPKNSNLNSEELGLKNVLDEVISEAGDSTPNANRPEEEPEKLLRDDALFKSIQKKKKKKKRRIIITVIIILMIAAATGLFGVYYLRRKVQISAVSAAGEVQSYDASIGSISTTVSGSGTLSNVDEEYIRVPEGVEIEEVVVSANDRLEAGDVVAKLNMASVRSTMASVQEEIENLDDEIYTAASETINKYINAGVGGRVKAIYCSKGDSIAECMVKNGALAVISLGGKMAMKINADGLGRNDEVIVVRGDGSGKELKGTVESVVDGIATVLVTDDGPEIDELVTVKTADGKAVGQARLYIYKSIRVTGISGRIYGISAAVNHTVRKGDTLFTLDDTTYSAAYESLIDQRSDKEELLVELMQLNSDGALLAPFAGSVSTVLYDDESSSASDSSSSASTSASSFSMGGSSEMSSVSSASASSGEKAGTEEGKIDVATISPDKLMEVSISVDESNILSLEVGQSAAVTVSSIGDDSYAGIVTEINKTATSASGVTRYSAVITLKKDEQMIPGMRAKVVVRIEGVDDAIIIPVDALHQTSSTSYVYTTYDEEVAEYGGLVKVEAGISNSSYVEIISGLKEGDTVYYVESESNDFAFGDFGGGMPGGDFDRGGNFGRGGNFDGGMPGDRR